MSVLGHPRWRSRTLTVSASATCPSCPPFSPSSRSGENLRFRASLYGVPLATAGAVLDDVLDLVDLTERPRKRSRTPRAGCSGDWPLAAASSTTPSCCSSTSRPRGIDPILRERFWTHFRHLRDEGRTLVVTTQYVGEAGLLRPRRC